MINKMYNKERGRCCIENGDILTIGEDLSILFTQENDLQIAKNFNTNDRIKYHDGTNFDEMFADLIINNVSNWDMKIVRDNEVVFQTITA